MKTNFEDIKRLESIDVPINYRNLLLSDDPIQNIMDDLKALQLFEQINACSSIDDVVKCLKIIHNINTSKGPIQTKEVIDLIENLPEDPVAKDLHPITESYGIQSKVSFLASLNRKTKLKSFQLVMEL